MLSTGTPPDWAVGWTSRSRAGQVGGRGSAWPGSASAPPRSGHRHGRAPLRHPAHRPERGRGLVYDTMAGTGAAVSSSGSSPATSGRPAGTRRVPPDPAGAGRGGRGARRIGRAQRDGGIARGRLGPRRRASRGQAARRRVVGRDGSRSRWTSSAGGWAPARRSIRRSPTPGGGRAPAGGGCGSTAWRTRSAGAASACGPASGPSSASLPNAPPGWCGSTTPPTFSRPATPPPSVAAESGYADQSHLHREVKAFTGLTPKAVAAAPWLAIDDVAWPDSVNH